MANFLGSDIPKLGFGLMRLPTIGQSGSFGDVDVEQVKQMVDLFMGKGFTYFDTAYVYNNSEMAIRDALVKRYPRDSFQLADKMPVSRAKVHSDLRSLFDTSLERTGVSYFDFYMLHYLNSENYAHSEKIGAWDFTKEIKALGMARHTGFSFHDTADVLETILTNHPETDFVQLQINYADWESDSTQSRLCYETARRHGKPVIIMEPVKGGFLADMTDEIKDIFKAARPEMSIPSWAIRYAASLEGVITVLSGMSNLPQMIDNLSTMASFQPLDDQEKAVIDRVVKVMESTSVITCTACNYCIDDCPQKINIPGIFREINALRVFGNLQNSKDGYGWVTSKGGKASDCIQCRVCEQHCPQQLTIVQLLQDAAATFD